jgi:hypothetical protein
MRSEPRCTLPRRGQTTSTSRSARLPRQWHSPLAIRHACSRCWRKLVSLRRARVARVGIGWQPRRRPSRCWRSSRQRRVRSRSIGASCVAGRATGRTPAQYTQRGRRPCRPVGSRCGRQPLPTSSLPIRNCSIQVDGPTAGRACAAPEAGQLCPRYRNACSSASIAEAHSRRRGRKCFCSLASGTRAA